MTDKVVVLSTCADGEQAGQIAEALVGSRLAACVQIIPGLTSVYRWKGGVERSAEHLLVIKSSRALLPELMAEIERIHHYEVPEAVALPVADGSGRYLDWWEKELKDHE